MDLKQLLGEELYNQVTSKLGDKKIMVDDGNFIPKARFDKVNDQKKELETQLKTSSETIETLKKNNSDNETLQRAIGEHEKTIEKLKKEAEDKDFSYSLRDALKEAGCIDSKALEVYLTKENLKLEDGKIVGLEEQLNSLKESKTYLFKDTIPQDTGGLGNFNRNTAAGGQTESLGERLAKQATESNQSNQHNYFGGAN